MSSLHFMTWGLITTWKYGDPPCCIPLVLGRSLDYFVSEIWDDRSRGHLVVSPLVQCAVHCVSVQYAPVVEAAQQWHFSKEVQGPILPNFPAPAVQPQGRREETLPYSEGTSTTATLLPHVAHVPLARQHGSGKVDRLGSAGSSCQTSPRSSLCQFQAASFLDVPGSDCLSGGCLLGCCRSLDWLEGCWGVFP